MHSAPLVLLAAFASPLVAQPAAPSARLARPDSAFGYLVGTWAGDAVTQHREGPIRLRQTEAVRVVAGGHALLIEGHGYRLGPDGTPATEPAFVAAALLVRTPAGYRIHAVTNLSATPVEALVDPKPDGLDWHFATPGGHVRYQIRLTPEGRWHETGTFTPPGGADLPTFEMTVARTAERAP